MTFLSIHEIMAGVYENAGRIISMLAASFLCLAVGLVHAGTNEPVVISTLVNQGYEKGALLFGGEEITIGRTRSFAVKLSDGKEYAFAVFGSSYFSVSLESGNKTVAKDTSGWFNYDSVAIFYYRCGQTASHSLATTNRGGGTTKYTTWLFVKKQGQEERQATGHMPAFSLL
jgi:hypothetical protein